MEGADETVFLNVFLAKVRCSNGTITPGVIRQHRAEMANWACCEAARAFD